MDNATKPAPEQRQMDPLTEQELMKHVDWNRAPDGTIGYVVWTDDADRDHARWVVSLTKDGVPQDNVQIGAPVFFGLKPGQGCSLDAPRGGAGNGKIDLEAMLERNQASAAESPDDGFEYPGAEVEPVPQGYWRDAGGMLHKITDEAGNVALAVDPGTGHAEHVRVPTPGENDVVPGHMIGPGATYTEDPANPLNRGTRVGENPHSGDISGYRKMTDGEVAAINHLKALEKHLGQDLRSLLLNADMGVGMTSDQAAQAMRWRKIAVTHFEEGFSALVRSIARPDERFRHL